MSKRKMTVDSVNEIIDLISDDDEHDHKSKYPTIYISDSDDDYVEIISNPATAPPIRLPTDIELRDLLNPQKGYVVIPYPIEIRNRFHINQFLQEQREFIRSDPS